MKSLRFTLVSDGSSDRALIPILTWLLRWAGIAQPIQSAWADFRWLPRPPKTLSEKILSAHALHPAELLFIHRDAETETYAQRQAEISLALDLARSQAELAVTICVIPVRMQEAWLLFDEIALRQAAGNPNGQEALLLPRRSHLERLPDPKSELHRLLRDASGLRGKRLKQFRPAVHAHRIGDFVEDFSPLLELTAFEALATEVRAFARANVG